MALTVNVNKPFTENCCICQTLVHGVSGSSVATANGSGSILLNFDSEEQTGPNAVGQQQQQQRLQSLPQSQQQQQHGRVLKHKLLLMFSFFYS